MTFDDPGTAYLVGSVAPALAALRCDAPDDAEHVADASEDAKDVLGLLPPGASKLADGSWVVIPTDHVVEFGDTEWGLEHPIDCRVAGLIRCRLHQAIETITERFGRPVSNGRYRLIELDTLGEDETAMAFVPQIGTIGFMPAESPASYVPSDGGGS